MKRTNEEIFCDILHSLNFELRKFEDDRFLLYGVDAEDFYPNIDGTADELDVSSDDFELTQDDNGVYRLDYSGNDPDISVEDISFQMTYGNAAEIIDELDTWVCEGYLNDIVDVCREYTHTDVLDSFDDAFKLEDFLKQHADTDPDAKAYLDMLALSFEEMHLIASDDIDNVSLDKVYELQEANKGDKEVKKENKKMTNEERYESILNKYCIELEIGKNYTYTLYDTLMDCYAKTRDIAEYCMFTFADIYGAQVEDNNKLNEIESTLQEKAHNGDKDAADMLERLGEAIEDLRFVNSEAFFNVDIYKVYELQEARKSKSEVKEKTTVERD